MGIGGAPVGRGLRGDGVPLEGMTWLRVRPEGEWGCPIASWLGVVDVVSS